MVGESEVDYIVIGAGMAGASVAANLAARGRLALLESEEQPGYHSTGRSAALFSEMYGNAVIRGLTRASRSFLFEPPPGFATSPLVTPRETLYFARHDQLDILQRFCADADIAEAMVRLSGAEVLARLPVFKPDYPGGGALDPGSADIDVDALHQGFLRQARARGARVHLRSEVRGLRRDGGQWVASTASGNFRAPVVINASGAWGDDIAARAGVTPVGLQPMRRTALLIEPPNEMSTHSWPAAIDIAEQFYFKPDAGLLLLSPADEIPSPACDAQPEDLEVAIAIDRFERATGAEVRKVKHRWAGLRVFAPDRSPVVGFDPIAKGFFWLVGQGGYGIQTAPAMGRVAAALAAGDPIPVDLVEAGVTAEGLAKGRFGMPRAA